MTGRTFDVDVPCPSCARPSLVGVLLVDQDGRHQHTLYVCTLFGCRWQGYNAVFPEGQT